MKVRLLMVVLMSMAAVIAGVAQGRGGPGFGVDGLNNALTNAGAPAMSSAQQAAITDLITSFRQSQAPPSRSAAASAARTAYENAILAGNAETAVAQVPILAGEMATNNGNRLKAVAGFAVGVIRVLDTSQLSLLVKQIGSSGVVRLVESLAGGPGMGGGRGPGMMGMRPPGM